MALLRKTYRSPATDEDSSRLNTTQVAHCSPSSRSSSLRPYSASNASPRRRIARLRERTLQRSHDPVTPETAARVVTDFLIPMFHAETRTHRAAARTNSFGLERQRQKSAGGRIQAGKQPEVYTELKLSEQLQVEVERLKEKLRVTERRMREAEQARESLDSDRQQSFLLLNKATSDLKLLFLSHSPPLPDLSSSHLQSQLLHFQLQHSQIESQAKAIHSQLREEKAKSDIRFPFLHMTLTPPTQASQ